MYSATASIVEVRGERCSVLLCASSGLVLTARSSNDCTQFQWLHQCLRKHSPIAPSVGVQFVGSVTYKAQSQTLLMKRPFKQQYIEN